MLPVYEEYPTDGLLKDHCTNLNNYVSFRDEVAAFNEELRNVIPQIEDLDDIRVRNWCLKAKYLFNDVFFKFVLDFCDHSDSADELISLNVEGYFVQKQDIIDLYVFGNLNWILYFANYHLAPNRRPKEDPNIDYTKGYYYSPPDPNAPTDLEAVKSLIAML